MQTMTLQSDAVQRLRECEEMKTFRSMPEFDAHAQAIVNLVEQTFTRPQHAEIWQPLAQGWRCKGSKGASHIKCWTFTNEATGTLVLITYHDKELIKGTSGPVPVYTPAFVVFEQQRGESETVTKVIISERPRECEVIPSASVDPIPVLKTRDAKLCMRTLHTILAPVLDLK